MSQRLINDYLKQLDVIKKVSGSQRGATIRDKFNTYRFADYKEKVVDLLRRVTRVSVETVRITGAMKTQPR